MRRWKAWFVAAMLVLAVLMIQENAYAEEPYKKIANSQEWQVLKRVNKERLAEGLEPLGMFKGIQKAAGIRAKEIATTFDHDRPDGTSCFTALKDCDVVYGWAGENIAAGYQTPAEVMNGWMNSQGHKENILGEVYTHIGVGYSTGGYYGKNWTQFFVGSCSVKSVAVNDKGTANYNVGTTIDEMDRYLIVKCDRHGISYVPVTAKMCSGYSAQKKGYQTVTIKYRGKKVKMPVTVGTSSSYKTPARVKELKCSARTQKTISLRWSRRNAGGYEVWMSTSANGIYKRVKTINSSQKTSYKVKGLKSGKRYYFKVRAYKKAKNKKIYGLFSEAVVVKTK